MPTDQVGPKAFVPKVLDTYNNIYILHTTHRFSISNEGSQKFGEDCAWFCKSIRYNYARPLNLSECKELAVCLHDPNFPTLDSQAKAGGDSCQEEIFVLM